MTTGKTTLYQLIQWQQAIGLEKKGLRFRASVKARAARFFGLSPRAKHDEVLEHVRAAIAAAKEVQVGLLDVFDLNKDPGDHDDQDPMLENFQKVHSH